MKQEKKEILIVDDEVDFRLDLAEILVEHGYKVATAPNGAEAIRHIVEEGKTPDLITVDFRMPLKDGIQFKEELARIDPTIPMILITGFTPQKEKLKGLSAVLTKPLDKTVLLSAVESNLRS